MLIKMKKDILNEYESHFISGYKDNKDDTEIIKIRRPSKDIKRNQCYDCY